MRKRVSRNSSVELELRADASLYTPEEAARLYVAHPEGLPTLDRNSLIVGPIGAGKTIMLKALCAKWRKDKRLAPVYVDVLRWTAEIAGESETYQADRLTPRGAVLLEALALATSLGLCESAGVFQAPQQV